MEKELWKETKLYGIVSELTDKFSDDEKKAIKNEYFKKYGDDFLFTIFEDEDFFTNFLNNIPEDLHEKYIQNTINYFKRQKYDPTYVIVSRRAVPSYKSKPENFWTTDSRKAINGLRTEIRDDQRHHSVIMISTLKKLQDHGEVITSRGTSDGEIAIDPNKNFDDFLFMFKPKKEFYKLVDFLRNGGITREDLLKELESTAYERAKRQGLPIKRMDDLGNEVYNELRNILCLDEITEEIENDIENDDIYKDDLTWDSIDEDDWSK